jgi:hypothetical protein
MKAKDVKAERTIVKDEYLCVVCAQKTRHPYGVLERYNKKRCVCSRTCNDLYLKGEYPHD